MSMNDGKAASEITAKSSTELESKPGGIVGRWIAEVSTASKTERDWRMEAEGCWELYRGGGEAGAAVNQPHARAAFPILWSNTETMRPAIFNSAPKADIRRRFRDDDPLGKVVSDVCERALEFCIETGHLFSSVKSAVLDMCVAGRGTVRVRYTVVTTPIEPNDPQGQEPTHVENKALDANALNDEQQAQDDGVIEKPHNVGAPADDNPERIVSEGVEFEHVQWDDFRRGPGKSWGMVGWEAFRHRMDYDELKELTDGAREQTEDGGDGILIADLIPLDSTKKDENGRHKEEETVYQAAEVWEIWDKKKRQVLWISEGYKRAPLRVDEDPLKLRNFFCTPRPVHMIEDSCSLIPIPNYRLYRDEARELEEITKRINKITSALKLRGLFHTGIPEISQVLDANDNEMIPVASTTALAQMRSIDDALWIMPVEKLAAVLQQLYIARQQTINVIFQITGISDIMRGDTKASETLGAQEIKSKWGTVRLQRVQGEVARFARDLVNMATEVVCNRFKLETLKAMTGVPLPMQADLQAAQATMQKVQQMQQQAAQAQQQGVPGMPPAQGAPGQPPQQQGSAQLPPAIMQAAQKAQKLLAKPISWEMVMQVMHSDMLMQYKVDIETDSTVQDTIASDMSGIQEVLTGIGQFIQAYGPLVQQGMFPVSAAKEIIMSICRRARLGTAVEDAFDQIGQNQGPKDPTQDQINQLDQMQQGLMKTAKSVGDKHEKQMEQIHSTDQTVMKTVQGFQKMQAQFVNTIGQAMDKLSAQNVGPALNEMNQNIAQFKQAITGAVQEHAARPVAQGGVAA
jgi:hypothetical protein